MINYNSIADNNYKIIIISDTHGFLDPKIINLITKYDYVIHAGDIMDENIITTLSDISKKTFVVNGNNDSYESVDNIKYIMTNAGKIVVTHGHKYAPNYHASMREKFNDAFLIVYGHTHKHIIDTATIPYVVNPGAAGRVRTQGGASCLIVTFDNKNFSFELKKFTNS